MRRRRPLRAVLWVLILLVAVSGCASAGGGESAGSGNELSTVQLRAGAATADETLYQSLIRLRPEWLVPATGLPEATVFVDGVQTGSPATLQVIAARAVGSVRFLAPGAAAGRFAGSWEGGVIEVTLLR